MVINIGALKARELELVAQDIRGVVQRCPCPGPSSRSSSRRCCSPMKRKPSPACCQRRPERILSRPPPALPAAGPPCTMWRLMRRVVGPEMGLKASGGVRTYEDAESMIKAGATRIGASAGVKIIQGPSEATCSHDSSCSIWKDLLGRKGHVNRQSDRNDRIDHQG